MKTRRPAKLTPALQRTLVALIKGGAGKGAACRAVGITTQTLRDWRRKARYATEPYASAIDEIEIAEAQIQAFGEQTIFKAGCSQRRYPRCNSCDEIHKQVRCHDCGADVDVRCPDCGMFLMTETPGDWRALAHWMRCQFPFKWSDNINVDVEAQLRAFMLAVRDEFDDQPAIFARVLHLAIQGGGEGVDPDRHGRHPDR